MIAMIEDKEPLDLWLENGWCGLFHVVGVGGGGRMDGVDCSMSWVWVGEENGRCGLFHVVGVGGGGKDG